MDFLMNKKKLIFFKPFGIWLEERERNLKISGSNSLFIERESTKLR